ncbi:unnamed protein product [Phytophthora fragariaefolia]|uniref:Unnamed protein product n=1 Tax=Phytophthora fragariaefolia TaxID=1490495 RepID=A0A9W6WRW9_9STRA|nr:unnamed protein product [Phytophthora fragariaefolia]
MGREKEDEYVTYELVTTPATATTAAETAKIKIKKFTGGSARDWLKWSGQFRSLARKKQWTDDQKAHNIVALIEGDLKADVARASQEAIEHNKSFEDFFTDVGLLSVPPDFSDDLDNELWTMTKHRDETVLKFSNRLKENIRMFAELPQDTEEIPEVQQCRYFKRGMPRIWQEKLAASGVVYDRLSELEKNHSLPDSLKNQRKDSKRKTGGDTKRDKWCSFHKTASHNTSDCYSIKKKEAEEQKRTEYHRQPKRKEEKRYPRIYKKSDDVDSDSDVSRSEEMKFVGLVEQQPSEKRAPLRVKSIVNSTMLAANVKLGRKFIPASATVFDTMSGTVTSSGTTVAQFYLPKLKYDTIITHRFEVPNDSPDAMVIGRTSLVDIGGDIMNELGLILNFKDKVVQWDDCFRSLNTGQKRPQQETNEQEDYEFPDEAKQNSRGAVEPKQLLPEHLEGEIATEYLALLIAHQKLYDGHLGRMRFGDYELPISPDFKPVHAKPYPVARSQEEKAKAKIQQLINADRAFAEAVLLSFPDFEKPFDVYADASGTQVGGLVMQGIRILACYSRSLTKHQFNYTTMELELLSIVELLREYRTMLLGFPVVVPTDHKNLIYPTETSLRVKRWKLLLSEYRLTMRYIKGEKNIGADAFSRMRFDTKEGLLLHEEIYASSSQPECIMHGPVIREHQENDVMIQKIKSACLTGRNNPDYQLVPLLGCTLVAYQKRVIVPDTLRDDMIAWYRQNLGHPA